MYSIPLAIIANESVPLGLTVGPTEHSQLFQQFYSFVEEKDPETASHLKTLPVLSDEGSAIEKFCEDNAIRRFLCFTHLIRKFGASSELGGLVKGLLFQKTKEDFLRAWNQKRPRIIQLLQENPSHLLQFEKLFGCQLVGNSLSDPNFNDQAIWEREQYHIPTTTNHAESTHSHVNFSARNVRSNVKRIQVLLKYIRQRFTKVLKRPNLRKSINFMKAIAKVKRNSHPASQCSCRKNTYKQSLYMLDVDFPCQHKIDSFEIPTFEPFKSLPHEESLMIREVNDAEKEWKRKAKSVFTKIPLTSDDMVMYQALGRPEMSTIAKVVEFLPSNANSKNPRALFGYIEMLFVHYCGHNKGEYCYEEEFVESFQKYAVRMIQHKSSNLIELNETESKLRDNRISSYNNHKRAANEDDINEEFFESNTEQNELTKITPGTITFVDEDTEEEDIEEEDIEEDDIEEDDCEDATLGIPDTETDETIDNNKEEAKRMLDRLISKVQNDTDPIEVCQHIRAFLEEEEAKLRK